MDFKAALLQNQPGDSTASIFKPALGDTAASGMEQQIVPQVHSLNLSDEESRKNGKRFRNHVRRRRPTQDSQAPMSLSFQDIPTITHTGPTPLINGESPVMEPWSYAPIQGRPRLPTLQAIALRARNRLATRIQTELVDQAQGAISLDSYRAHIFAQLHSRLAASSIPVKPRPDLPPIVQPSQRLGRDADVRTYDQNLIDSEVDGLKDELKKERETAAKARRDLCSLTSLLVQAQDEAVGYRSRLSRLEKERDEMTLKMQEQEATIQAFGKPRVLLSRSSSSSSWDGTDHGLSSSSTTSSSLSERELAFSTANNLILRRQKSTRAIGTLTPPKAATVIHRRGSSLQHISSKVGLSARPLNNVSNTVGSDHGFLKFKLPRGHRESKVPSPPLPTPMQSVGFGLDERL